MTTPDPVIPADTPAEHLAAWAQTNPELHAEIAAHPNAHPDLVAWIAQYGHTVQPAVPQTPTQTPTQPQAAPTTAAAPAKPAKPAKDGGRPRWVLPTAVVAALALIAGGVATAFVLSGDDGEPSAADRKAAEKRTILGEPKREWSVNVADLVDEYDVQFFDPRNDVGRGARAYLFDETVVVQARYGDGDASENGQVLLGLDPEDGTEVWRRDSDEQSCQAGQDSAGRDALIFCSGWSDDNRFVVLDPATGKPLLETSLDHSVQGLYVEDDGTILTYGHHSGEDYAYELVVSHGTLDDIDADWSHTHPDPTAVDTHGLSHDLVDQGDTWGITAMGRLWVVDKKSGRLRTPDEATVHPFNTALPDGGWLTSDSESDTVEVRDADGSLRWSTPDARWMNASVDGKYAIAEYQDDDYTLTRSEIRDVRTGEVLATRQTGSNISSTTTPGLFVATTDELAEVITADGRVLYDSKDAPVRADLDDPGALVQWNTGNGDFAVRDARTGDITWSRTGFETSTSDEPIDTHAASRDGVLVATSTHEVHGFSGFPKRTSGTGAKADGDGTQGDGAEGEGGTQYATACGREPEFEPVTTTARDGGVTIEFVVKAVCPGGQWLSGSNVQLAVTASGTGTGTGTEGAARPLAQGQFDFSSEPVWIPEDGKNLRAWFPVGRVWGTEREIQDAIDAGIVTVDCITEDTDTSPAPDAPTGPDTDTTEEVESQDPGTTTEERDDREQNSLDALRRLAAEDKQPALDEIAGMWVPQLSSKQDGTHDDHDAKTYTYTDIYEQHLELRLRYPAVRLLWSGDWGSFKEDDYWVTVAGVTYLDAQGALTWCEDEGFAASQCYAKQVNVGGDHEDTTKHRTQ